MARGRPRKNSDTPSSEDQSAPESQTTLERDLFLAADKLRKNLEPSDYKHVVLGLIFLRHISLAFEARHEALLRDDPAAAEDRDEYTGTKPDLVSESRLTNTDTLDDTYTWAQREGQLEPPPVAAPARAAG